MLDLKAFAQKLGLDWDVSLTEDKQPVLNAEEEEQLSCSYSSVELVVGDPGSSVGTGSVFVTTRRLVWVPDSSSGGAAASSSSIACSYKQISMHAVARDTEAFPKPCVYIQLDEGSVGMGAEAEEDEGEEQEEEESAELRLVPAQDSEVESLFQAVCDASALNPDSDMEEEAGAQLFFDEAEVLAGLPDDQRAALLAARAEEAMVLDGVDELMAQDPERFEDEDDFEEEGEGDVAAANGHAS